MRQVSLHANLKQFYEMLKRAQHPLLFLDYDGTLAPFNQIRSLAKPYPGMMEEIYRLMMETRTEVVIISGRAIKDLLPFIALNPIPELIGSHGGERLKADQKYTLFKLTEEQKDHLAKGKEIALKYVPMERCENKPLSMAIHWRNLKEEEKERIKNALKKEWEPLVSNGLEIHCFNQGMELRPLNINKGHMVDQLILEKKPDCIAYCGDDMTDEDAFEKLGDRGLKVLVSEDERKTFADIQITAPTELLQFLQKWRLANAT